ncbi:MAG: hypothetical protein ABIW19_13200 [Vicinamibacterales bacterium]
MGAPPTIAVFNTSPDTVDMLRIALEHAGFVVVTGMTFDIRDGRVDLNQFLDAHDPAVIVYDVALPYEANWNLLTHLRQSDGMKHRPIIVTTTNARQVAPLAEGEPILEIVGKPYDLGVLVDAVHRALAK